MENKFRTAGSQTRTVVDDQELPQKSARSEVQEDLRLMEAELFRAMALRRARAESAASANPVKGKIIRALRRSGQK